MFFKIPSKIYKNLLWICISTTLFHFVMKSNAPVLFMTTTGTARHHLQGSGHSRWLLHRFWTDLFQKGVA